MTGAFGSSMRTARAGARCMCVQKCEYACVSAWCMMNPNVYRTYVQGIVAREAIREGDLLFKIPLKWCMHSVAAKRNKYLAKPLSQGVLPRGMQGEAIMVALLLMVEACQIGEASSTCALRAQTSAWLPYIRALPTNFSAPVFWSTSFMLRLSFVPAMDITLTFTGWPRLTTSLVSIRRPFTICET